MSNPRRPPTTSSRRTTALEELKRSQQRSRRGRLLIAAGLVTAIVLIATALVVTGLNREPATPKPSTVASGAVISAVTTIPVSTLNRVGAGTSTNHPSPIEAPALTQDGKPRVLYVGAEFCPFCAAQRWAVVAAMARFGTFTGLGQTTSATDDVYPDTATLSFHGSTYTSRYLSFTGVETTSNKRRGNGYAPLDTLTPADQELLATYNAPPYVKGQGGSIPFMDLGGTFVSSGASYDPQLLAGKTHGQIGKALADPDSTIARAIDGAANVYTAALCTLTDGQPGTVCRSAGVRAAAQVIQQ